MKSPDNACNSVIYTADTDRRTACGTHYMTVMFSIFTVRFYCGASKPARDFEKLDGGGVTQTFETRDFFRLELLDAARLAKPRRRARFNAFSVRSIEIFSLLIRADLLRAHY